MVTAIHYAFVYISPLNHPEYLCGLWTPNQYHLADIAQFRGQHTLHPPLQPVDPMSQMDPPADDSDKELNRLLDISRAFKLSKALNLAGKLGLVSLCARKPQGLTLSEACEAQGWTHWLAPAPPTASPVSSPSATDAWPQHVRGVADYLDLLVSMRVLHRTGAPGPEARYSPHPDTFRFLLEGSDDCITGILTLNNDRSAPLFHFLEDALRSGQVPDAARASVPDIRDTFASASGSTAAAGGASGSTAAAGGASGSTAAAGGAEHFAMGMLGASRANFARLAQVLSFSRSKHVVDIGGSTGACCVALCTAHPHLTATTCDLPAVRPTAEKFIDQHNLTDRIQVVDLDFFSDAPFPEADVVVLGMVLHDWGVENKRMLIRKAKAALRPGGMLVAVECLIDDDRAVASAGLASSLNMLLEFGEEAAGDFSLAEFSGWVLEAGFTRAEKVPLVGNFFAAVAHC